MTRALRCLLTGAMLAAQCVGAGAQGDPKRGEYIAKISGCRGCHTEDRAGAAAFAGGRAIDTPFGRFYGPNLTPHPEAGIGRWTQADFRRALRSGERPDGAHLYPSFPYPSFTRMTDADIADLWAYLRTLMPSPQVSRMHELRFPFGWRFILAGWKWLFFRPGPFVADPSKSAESNRGAYLASALGHCSECHTPRNFLGGPRDDRWLAGGRIAEGRTPNLTPTRLKRWTDRQLADFLRTGATPEGDVPSEVMDEVIRNSTSQLSPQDLSSLIAYLRSLPPLPDEGK